MNKQQGITSNEFLDILSGYKNAVAIYKTSAIIIEMANDAMIRFWGKDRSVIGKPMVDAIPELKNQPFIGMLRNVLETGIDDVGSAIRADLVVDGKLQTYYFDYEYRAIKDASGKPYCVFHTAEDVTERVLGLKAMEVARERKDALDNERAINEELSAANEELAATNEELAATNEELHEAQNSLSKLNDELEQRVAERTAELSESEARLRYLLADAPVGIAVLNASDMTIEAANTKMLKAWGKSTAIIGETLRIAIPELVGQDFLDLLDSVVTSGKPYYGNEVKTLIAQNGIMEELYVNFVYHPLKDDTGRTVSVMLVSNDVTEQVNARKLIEASEKRFSFMLNTIPQQVWSAGKDGALDYVNQVVCNDFGYSAAEIVGHGWQKFIHPDDLHSALKKWQHSLRTGEEYVVEFRLLFSDGAYKWHLARALPLIENGEINIWFGTNTNIDEQKNNEQKKDEFLSIASHELKTPLTSIKAFNQLMSRPQDPDKMQNFIHKSANHIYRLERLINDLLDVTKINAGKMNYAVEPFNFVKMLKDSIETLQHTTDTHQIILEQSPQELTFTGDQFRLEQVMNNFLTNAVKYAPKADKVLVNCIIEHNNVVVSVQDFGIGIATENLDKLFDRYYRVDNTSMRFEGLGLGLFISSEILKRHKGSFWLESEQGKGSTFYFRLPLSDESEMSPLLEAENHFQYKHLTINYNVSKKRIELDWKGFQTLVTIQHGCLKALEIIKKHHCTKIVNDNTHVVGTWSEASDWAGEVFFPLMEQAGVKHLAWVYSPSVFSQLAANKTIDVFVGNITTQFFTEVSLAEEWVDSKD